MERARRASPSNGHGAQPHKVKADAREGLKPAPVTMNEYRLFVRIFKTGQDALYASSEKLKAGMWWEKRRDS